MFQPDPNTYLFYGTEWGAETDGSATKGWGIATPIRADWQSEYGLNYDVSGPFPAYADALAAFLTQPGGGTGTIGP